MIDPMTRGPLCELGRPTRMGAEPSETTGGRPSDDVSPILLPCGKARACRASQLPPGLMRPAGLSLVRGAEANDADPDRGS
jgi:hypothetical protein